MVPGAKASGWWEGSTLRNSQAPSASEAGVLVSVSQQSRQLDSGQSGCRIAGGFWEHPEGRLVWGPSHSSSPIQDDVAFVAEPVLWE